MQPRSYFRILSYLSTMGCYCLSLSDKKHRALGRPRILSPAVTRTVYRSNLPHVRIFLSGRMHNETDIINIMLVALIYIYSHVSRARFFSISRGKTKLSHQSNKYDERYQSCYFLMLFNVQILILMTELLNIKNDTESSLNKLILFCNFSLEISILLLFCFTL